MSLYFDLTAIPEENRTQPAVADCPDGDYKKGELVIHPVTNALIWATLSVGMNSITEENHRKFYDRLRLQQKLFGPELRQGGAPYFISLDEVKRNIGLKTNADNKADAAWLKLTFASHQSEVERELRVAAKKGA